MKHRHEHEHGVYLPEVLKQHSGWEARMIRRTVLSGCAVNIILMIMKLLLGHYGHSDALVADGFHSLGDVCSDIIMLAFVGLSFHRPTKSYSYGFGKFQSFASFLISCLLLFVVFHISEEAVESIIQYSNGETLPHPDIWTLVAILAAMSAKEVLYRFYLSVGKKTRCMALLSSAWHHRADALASIAALVGIASAHFLGEQWRVLDPVASLIIALLILIMAIRLLGKAFKELMDGMDKDDVSEAAEIILNSKGVIALDSLKCRKSGPNIFFDVKIEVDGNLSVRESNKIASDIESALIEEFGLHTVVNVMAVCPRQA